MYYIDCIDWLIDWLIRCRYWCDVMWCDVIQYLFNVYSMFSFVCWMNEWIEIESYNRHHQHQYQHQYHLNHLHLYTSCDDNHNRHHYYYYQSCTNDQCHPISKPNIIPIQTQNHIFVVWISIKSCIRSNHQYQSYNNIQPYHTTYLDTSVIKSNNNYCWMIN